jgi:hypothetical protein
MKGVSEEHIRCDMQRMNNDADGPFSSQPFGPLASWLIFRVAHLDDARRSRLENQPTG